MQNRVREAVDTYSIKGSVSVGSVRSSYTQRDSDSMTFVQNYELRIRFRTISGCKLSVLLSRSPCFNTNLLKSFGDCLDPN
jgi:hypothetical protein